MAIPASVVLSINCNNLYTEYKAWLCRPLVKVSLWQSDKWVDIGQTEHGKRTNDPQFIEDITVIEHKHVIVDGQRFDEIQKIRFLVYDVQDDHVDHTKLTEKNHIGKYEWVLGDIVVHKSVCGDLIMKGEGKEAPNIVAGSITIHAHEEKEGDAKRMVTFQPKATNVDNKDRFSLSDPYLEIFTTMSDGLLRPVHRTNVVENNLSPTWNPICISMRKLCNEDLDLPLKMICWDSDDDGDTEIGELSVTLREMLDGQNSNKLWELIKPKKLSKKGYKNSGTITFLNVTIDE